MSFAIGVALLATFFTFAVLTGLTPIEPTREVVISFLMINGAMILVLVAIIARIAWQMVQASRRWPGSREVARPDRWFVFCHGGATGRADGDGRLCDSRPR